MAEHPATYADQGEWGGSLDAPNPSLAVSSSHVSTLAEAALAARERAYAPYSGYAVGAALEDEAGRVHAGCNVENVSYRGDDLRRARRLGADGRGGRAEVRRVAVATADGGAPCGICLQSLLEFAPDPSAVEIELLGGAETTTTLGALMPRAFASREVRRAE